MKDFIAIDFETANPQRVSACAIYPNIYHKIKEFLGDEQLDCIEAAEIKLLLLNTLREIE